jgi:uncharacterized protein (DUF1697 family)
MARYVALLRGINVGTANRISMPVLRELFTAAGHTSVATLLNSGNVVFDSTRKPDAAALEQAIVAAGARSRVLVVPADRFRQIAAANPLLEVADDPSKMVITFVSEVPDPASIERPSDEELAPEVLVFGEHAVYQWFPLGILKSRLSPRFIMQLGPDATSRNQRTVGKILELLEK